MPSESGKIAKTKVFYGLPHLPLTLPAKERDLWFTPDFNGLLLLKQVALVYSLPMAGVHVDQQALTKDADKGRRRLAPVQNFGQR